jgi:hypothetical protein
VPKGPKGQRRPADVIGAAVHVMRIATGEIEDKGKDPAAVALGARGGKARASKMNARQRRAVAKKAAAARWNKS